MSTSPRSSPPPPQHSHSHSHTHSRHSHPRRTPSPTPHSPPPASPTAPATFLVRALHPFSPSTLTQSSASPAAAQANSCLTFDAGDLIRCLNVDESGWWDGELVRPAKQGLAGARSRGWFPRNYVEVVDESEADVEEQVRPPSRFSTACRKLTPFHLASDEQVAPPLQLSPEAHTLLSSIEQNVGLLENAVRAQRKGHYQPSTACVISSIRTVLSSTSCLTRDSPVLRSHPPLSSARKKILSALAQLVNQARKASAPALPAPPDQSPAQLQRLRDEQDEHDRQDAQTMLDIANATVVCVQSFLDEAERRGVEVNLGLGAAPPAASGGLTAEGSAAGAGRDLRAAKSMGNLKERRPTLEALQLPTAGGAGNAFPVRAGSNATIRPAPTASPSLATSTPPTDPPSTTPTSAFSPALLPLSSSSAAALSTSETLTLRTASALSLHLSTLHDALLSTIAALIGHVHSHARSTSPASSFAQLIDLTREGIERVRDCLVVVERVAAEVVRREAASGRGEQGPGEEMKVLAGARERLYEATTTLVSAARVATSPLSAASSPVKGKKEGARAQDEDERKALLGAATGVLRAGGDCVGAVKLVAAQFSAGEGGGAAFELVLPRPRTGEELAKEAEAREGGGVEVGSESEGEGEGEGTSTESAGAKFADAVSGDERAASPAPAGADGAGVGSYDPSPRRRNPHTLSMLGRKATSLGNLRGRFEADLRLDEAEEDEQAEGDGEGEEDGSGGSTATVETARSELTSSSTPAQADPPRQKGHDRVKTSSISLSPAHANAKRESASSTSASFRAPSPSPSSASSAPYSSPPLHRSTSPTVDRSAASHPMSRAFSSGSGHSARSARSARSAHSSSRATAASTASTVATALTAETSPRNSFQSTAGGAAAGQKRSTRPGSAGLRSSLGSVRERDQLVPSPPLPVQFPSTASSPIVALPPPVPSPASSAFGSLAVPRPSTPDRDRKNSTVGPVPASPSGRDRSNVPWFLEREYLPREVSFNADGHVSGGTLRCLVERMTLHDTTIDAGFSNTFLLTFRMFTTPLELATILFARFDLAPPSHPDTGAPLSVDEAKQWTASKLTPIRLRIYNLFKTWVEGYWLHDPDREIVEPLLEWCRGRLRAAMPSAAQRLVDLVNKRVIAAQQDEAAARDRERASMDDSPTNASTTSLGSTGSGGSGSLGGLSAGGANGSTLSLALSPAQRNGLVGGNLLHRMQSTERLKAGKPVVPYSASFSSTSSAVDSYSPSSSAAAHAPAPVVTRALLAALRPGAKTHPAVVDIDPLELARQLTIMESRVYGSIRPDELLGSSGGASGGGAAGAKDGAGKNANVRKMSALSTRLTGWIAETILSEQDQKRRTGLVKYFIKLGERLLHLANYNALFAVLTALNSSTIARLRRTWDGLAPKYKAVFEVLRKATDHARNYAEYRQKIRQAVPPCLPFVGLFLTDLIFIFEGNRAERPSPVDPSLRLINFDRYHKMARIVGELQRFQVPYQLVEVPEIQGYLAQQLDGLKNGQDAQSLYRQSLFLEPRAGQPSTGPASSAASTYSTESKHHLGRFNWPG
ncbi:hypothetical protein JCM10207_000046 [Rhodosporidiobolus poonsookiae]